MKKLFTILILALVMIFSMKDQAESQTGFNTVLEYCTGTWCVYCPEGHAIIDAILTNYPETVVLGYHGPPGSSDPWASYSGNMISLFGFAGYPQGVIGRKSGVLSRSGWNNQVVLQSNTQQPTMNINIASMNYNSSTRELTAQIEFTEIGTLTGDQRVSFVLTEDNMIYPQTGGNSNYVHKHVVKGLINGEMGEALAFTGDNSTVTKNLTYTIPSGFVAENCHLNIIGWVNNGSMSSANHIGQSKSTSVDNPTGIHNTSNIAASYELKQNYPNPFNPTTNIIFSIPKDGDVSLKFYDMVGKEVSSFINSNLKAGTYNVGFDGSNLPSGVYFYTLSTNDFSETKKMILTK